MATKYLKHQENYINNPSENTIHIGYGVDDNYTRCMASSIASLCKNNPNTKFTIHVMTAGLLPENMDRLKTLAKTFNTNIILYTIDTSALKDLPTHTHLPLPTYFRFILPLILNDVERLFYIDADIVCLKNAYELFNLDFQGNIIAAVPDLPWMNRKRNEALHLKNHTYFNAGMLAIDIPKWNEFGTFNKVLDAIHANPDKFRYLDQDALNLVLSGHIKYLPTIYNCIDTEAVEKTTIVLLHFAAHPKPWNIAFPISNICTRFNANLYSSFEKLTPWVDTPLDLPRNYKECKVYAKALRHNHQYFRFLWYYLKYLKFKY